MRFNDPAPDGLEVEHAGIAGKMLAQPGATARLDRGIGCGMHGPEIEGALPCGLPGGMPPPARLAVYHRHVRADVPAFEQRHPEVAGGLMVRVVSRRCDDAAVGAQALEIVDGLGEHRKRWRRRAMRSGIEALA